MMCIEKGGENHMFGERLQQLRSQRDMKQAVLAKRLGVAMREE